VSPDRTGRRRITASPLLPEQRLPQRRPALHAGLEADQRGRARRGPQDVPRFRLAVGLALQAPRRFVVGVHVDGQHPGAVDELGQHREVRAAPAAPDQLVGVLRGQLAQAPPGERAVLHGRTLAVHVAAFPGLGDRAVRQASAAQQVRDAPAAEDVLGDRRAQLQRRPLHGGGRLRGSACRR
jgi:hypothetical protein